MAMPAQHTEWTVEMVRTLPDDGNRYEVIDLPPFFDRIAGQR